MKLNIIPIFQTLILKLTKWINAMVINGRSKISGIGISLPPQIVTSQSLMEEIQSDTRFGIPVNWVDTRIGAEERRVASSETLPSDLATEATEYALAESGIKAEHISLIIYCGIEKDFMEPGTAHIVQRNIGSNAVCLDVSNACQGLFSGISVADSMIATGAVDSAIVCSGELASKSVKKFLKKIKNENADYLRDRLGVMTVGDAGSAVVLTRKDDHSGIKNLLFDSRGEYAEYCYFRYTEDGDVEGQMLMKGITETIEKIHIEMISNTYHYLDWTPDSIDILACHQVGKKSVRSLVQIAEIPENKIPITYKLYGNTATCTIPIALSIAKPYIGDKILVMGGGSGLSSFQGGIEWSI
jgi:3-oxoacyl-[acyl-carrier-protein] synthase III